MLTGEWYWPTDGCELSEVTADVTDIRQRTCNYSPVVSSNDKLKVTVKVKKSKVKGQTRRVWAELTRPQRTCWQSSVAVNQSIRQLHYQLHNIISIHIFSQHLTHTHTHKVKGKVLLYSLPSVRPGADPSVQAVSPQVSLSHPPGGRLPLLFRQACSYLRTAFTRWRYTVARILIIFIFARMT